MYHPNREKQARRRRKSVFSSAEITERELVLPRVLNEKRTKQFFLGKILEMRWIWAILSNVTLHNN